MRKVVMWMVVLVGIVFEVRGMSTVRMLPKEREKKRLALVAQGVDQIVQKYPGSNNLYLYNKNDMKGVWLNKESAEMSFTLEAATTDLADGKNAKIPLKDPIEVIQTFSQILSKCAESKSEGEYPNIIREQIKDLNFADMLSTFKLAHFLHTKKDIFGALIFEIQEKMTTLFKKGISFTENDFIVLQNITSNHEGAVLFPDKKFDDLLEVIRKDIRQQFLRNELSNEKIFYKTNAIVLREYEVSHLSLNKDGSRVWYTYSKKNSQDLLGLYGLNIKDLSQIFRVPRIMQKPPCWIDEKTIAYIEFVSFGENQAHKLILHDCVASKDISRIMNAKNKHELIQRFNPLQLLCSGQKIMFLYSHSGGYGVGIGDSSTMVIKHSDLDIKNPIRLLPIKDGYFFCVSYDHSGEKISLYKGNIKEDNFLANVGLDKLIDIKGISEDIFSKGIINGDGSKIAFIIGDEICLLSFNNLKTDRFRCEGVDKISALAFSPNDKLLMIAGNKEIIVFDVIEKEIISELSFQEAEAFDRNDSMAFSENGKFFAVGGHSENRDEFLMMTSLESDQDLKKLYLNVVNEMAKEKKEFPFGERVFLYLLSLRSKNQEKLEPLTNIEKQIFQSFDEDIQEVLTEIKYVAPGQMSEEPASGKRVKLSKKLSLENDGEDKIDFPRTEEKKSYLRTFLEKAWQSSSNFWDSFMKYFPSSG